MMCLGKYSRNDSGAGGHLRADQQTDSPTLKETILPRQALRRRPNYLHFSNFPDYISPFTPCALPSKFPQHRPHQEGRILMQCNLKSGCVMLRYVANNETQTTRKPLRHKKWLVQITERLWISKQMKKETTECQLENFIGDRATFLRTGARKQQQFIITVQ